MRKRLSAILATILAVSLVVGLSPGKAATLLTVTDASNDLMDQVLNLRTAYANAASRPGGYQDTMDITKFTWDASGGFITVKVTTAGAWPPIGAPATAITEAGAATSGEWRAVFITDGQDRPYDVGISCDARSEEIENPLTGELYHPVQYAESNCEAGPYYDPTETRDGPFYKSDGFRMWAGLGMTITAGKISYEWSGHGRYLPLIQSFTWLPGAAHDKICAAAGCSKGELIFQDPVTVGNLTWYKTTGIKIPYKIRNDVADDHDGYADESRAYGVLQAGDAISSVTVGTYGTQGVRVPEEQACPFGDPVPSPLNDPDDCYQVNYGLTGIFDWAPGNPFQTVGGQPNWGGYRPRSFPRSPSWLPTAASATCSYPTGGYGVRMNQASANTGGGYLVNGTQIDIPPDGGSTVGFPTIANPIPSNEIAYPTGREQQKCGFFVVDTGLHFDDTGNGTAAGLVAG